MKGLRNWVRTALFALFALAAALWIPTMTAFAHDCSSDLLNAADCLRTPGPRQVITTGIGLAGAAGVAIQNALNGGKEGEKEQEKEPEKEGDFPGEDPCTSDRDQVSISRANLRALFASRESIQSYLTMLETQYEDTRESAYWSGAVNVAFLGASVWGRAIRGAIGVAVARTLAQNIAVSLGTMLGQKVATNVLNTLSGVGITPEDLVNPALDSSRNELIKDTIKQAVLQDRMGVLGQGLDPNGPVYQAVRRGVDTNLAGPMADLFGDTMSVLSTGKGIIDGAQRLEGIRGLISRVSSRLSDIDFQIMDARDALELAQHSLDLCMKGESYARYLRRLAFSRLPSQG